ncbi:NBS-LRR-like resistance protein [Rhynchospora pubera]|uniref:NBS-LRR-like resistance protein n=1 Tax=Rhynchospora pubera TaxID=906938 RepID=A0AAV8FU24_9POAL|nr:NBS-LRR-like resistance protein [Rhynchospora pubera]
MWGIDDQRQRLQIMLLEIEARLPDAEERAISNTAVKSWLERLKSATYDANDMLDKFCYEELRLEAVRRGHKVGNVSGFFSLENPVLFRYKMSGKLKKSVEIISDLVDQMRAFGFGLKQHGQVANYRDKTDSHVVESIVGRDEDKEKIVNLLLGASDSVDLTIVPIVGMGGLGKTTIALLVYNDSRIKERFKFRLWVYVSEEFNTNNILKTIIDLIIQEDCKVPIDNRELLKRCLHQHLDGKRYFLVLDDVWNEDIHKWERLRALLNGGDSGSVIIVTTRSSRVATIMGMENSYNLRCLGDYDSWNLFHKRAFSKGLKESQELVEIGKKIVQNGGGLPLAINTLGSLLMSCKYEVQEWLIILEESMIWGTRSTNV